MPFLRPPLSPASTEPRTKGGGWRKAGMESAVAWQRPSLEFCAPPFRAKDKLKQSPLEQAWAGQALGLAHQTMCACSCWKCHPCSRKHARACSHADTPHLQRCAASCTRHGHGPRHAHSQPWHLLYAETSWGHLLGLLGVLGVLGASPRGPGGPGGISWESWGSWGHLLGASPGGPGGISWGSRGHLLGVLGAAPGR
eukprot:358480-Chlamydomonas_euryale.AAC.5